MGVTRSMHVEAHLLDNILNIRTRQGEVLESTDDGALEWSVGRRRALDGGHLSLSVDRRGGSLAFEHASLLQNLVGILLLMKMKANSTASDLNAEEVVKSPQVLKGELGAEATGE